MHLRTQLLAAIIMTSCGILLGAGTNSLYLPDPALSVEEAGEMQVPAAALAAISNAEAGTFTEMAVISEERIDSMWEEREYEDAGDQKTGDKDTGDQETGEWNSIEGNEDYDDIAEIETDDWTGIALSAPGEGEGVIAEMEAGTGNEETGSSEEEPGISAAEAEASCLALDGTPSDAVLTDAESEAANSEEAQLCTAYTEEDLYILAHVICGEAQCYPDDEQRYVGSVVLNRVANSRYPGTIKDVVFQKGQYACTRDGNYYREPTEANWANAKWLLENGSVLPVNVVYQSRGKQGSGVYLQTKYHKYCY